MMMNLMEGVPFEVEELPIVVQEAIAILNKGAFRARIDNGRDCWSYYTLSLVNGALSIIVRGSNDNESWYLEDQYNSLYYMLETIAYGERYGTSTTYHATERVPLQ